jgi:hypothetical protein
MAIALPEGRCQSKEVLDAWRLRAVHAWELGDAVGSSVLRRPVSGNLPEH